MSFAKVYSAQNVLLSARIITIEADISRGLHAFAIVGLPDKAVEESRDRVSSAIKNSGFDSPKSKNHKIVVSLAPADLKKEGPVFDMGIALAYLLASGEVKFDPESKLFIGELSLDGDVQRVKGILPLVQEAREKGFAEIFVPKENAREAALVQGITIYGVSTLKELVAHLAAKKDTGNFIEPEGEAEFVTTDREQAILLEDIRGQATAKRALEIAAAGAHNLALYGPPGTGKTMLARALAGILPPLSFHEAMEVTAIHSIAGSLREELSSEPPFRSPHHTSSYVSLVGGGTNPRPGEITLAHRGVLFMDEFPEFDRRVIEALRQPLEERVVSVSRAKGSALFPAHVTLVAAMNPCPCGKYGSRDECSCTPTALIRYRQKMSGPIADRIDLWTEVAAVSASDLSQKKRSTSKETDAARDRVARARALQQSRYANESRVRLNSDLSAKHFETFAALTPEIESMLANAATKLRMSARAYHRVIKVARTIADLEESSRIREGHVLEALQYRPKSG